MFKQGMWPSGSRGLLDPGRLLRDFERVLDAFTTSPWSAFGDSTGVFPALNISRDKDRYYIRAELPGVRADDLNITTEGNKLTLSGERRIPDEAGVSYHRRERTAGKFSRTVTLPGPCDSERVEAKYLDGVLTISLPIAEAAKARRITVNKK
jgi:HSP20 family protein